MKDINGCHNSKPKLVWGSKDWFHERYNKSISDGTGYFDHDKNGYQIYRHNMLSNIIRSSTEKLHKPYILELGCGMGTLSNRVATNFQDSICIGTDFLYNLIQDAKFKYPKIIFFVSSLPEIPISDNLFDIVIVSEVLYYLNSDQRDKSLLELKRITKKNGIIVFSSPIDDGRKYFTQKGAIKYMEKMFTIEKIIYNNYKLYFIIKRLLNRIRRMAIFNNNDHGFLQNSKKRKSYTYCKLHSISKLISKIVLKIEKKFMKSQLTPHLLNHNFGVTKNFSFVNNTNIIIIAKNNT